MKIQKTIESTTVISLTSDQTESIIIHYLRKNGLIPKDAHIQIQNDNDDVLHGVIIKSTTTKEQPEEFKLT